MKVEEMVALEARDEVLKLGAETRLALRRTEVVTRRLRRQIERSTPVTESMLVLGIGDVRQDLSDHLDALVRARHEAQHAIVALAVSQGVSRGQLARVWGVSRQLVSRLAKEH